MLAFIKQLILHYDKAKNAQRNSELRPQTTMLMATIHQTTMTSQSGRIARQGVTWIFDISILNQPFRSRNFHQSRHASDTRALPLSDPAEDVSKETNPLLHLESNFSK